MTGFDKKLRYHRLTDIEVQLKPHYEQPGRPRKEDKPKYYTYHIQGTLALNEPAVEAQRNQAGRFVLATNLLDDELWTNETILQEYKNQQSCERGFRFLKDPLFLRTRVLKSPQNREMSVASRMFVKLSQRVAALAMIMSLCLIVYSIGQRQLRSSLAEAIETIPNQRGKPTARPTLRWVLQCFQSVHLVWVSGRKWSIKLTDTQKHIVRFLGSACQKYYFLC